MSMTLDASQELPFPLTGFRPESSEAVFPDTGAPQRNVYLTIRWVVEFGLAAVLLVLTGPVILLCAMLIKLTSRGPAFYSQVRVGLGGQLYWIHKLRTMYHRCEAVSGPRWSQRGDPRITPLGRFLRATHLDELPQLWNILCGEMSLIGPRPERPEFVPGLAAAIPLYRARLLVRPGVTGLAQVQAPADTDLESVRAKVAYDLHYIREANLWLDLRILFATAFKVVGVSFGVLRAVFRFSEHALVDSRYRALQQAAPVNAAAASAAPC
jgi:lipopolysaccharide/colanic/teichoic acid biosynthesis glycosyltransferase